MDGVEGLELHGVRCARCSEPATLDSPWWGPVQQVLCQDCTSTLQMYRQEQAPKADAFDGPWLISNAHPVVILEPGDGAWIPVRKSGAKDGRAGRLMDDPQIQYVVMPLANAEIEPVPGTWGHDAEEGIILITNLGQEDKVLRFGAPVAGLHRAAVQTRVCETCGAQDHDAMLCSEMTKDEPAWCPLPCEVCGREATTCAAWIRETSSASTASAADAPHCALGSGQKPAEAVTLFPIERRVEHPSYHIVEEPGAIEWRNEIEVPTEEYYDALRADMRKRFEKLGVTEHGLDHVISVEALLDIAILSGFSFCPACFGTSACAMPSVPPSSSRAMW